MPLEPSRSPACERQSRWRVAGTDHGICIELCAHNSLTRKGMHRLILSVAIGPAITAAYCVWQGFWPVLPFAGLELLILWLALRHSFTRGEQRQTIRITADHVTISTQSAPQVGVPQVNTCFPRHWTRVRLSAPQSGLYPSRLSLESAGQACEVGSFLTEEERCALAVQLQQLVGSMNQSPVLSDFR